MEIKTYKNKLRLVVNTKKDVDAVSFKIFVNVGSRDENEDEKGYSHFLEHMFFKSTKNHTYSEILKKLDDLVALKNAYTGINTTCYYFKCLKSVLNECTEIFSEMFFNNRFLKEEIEKEKLVITEELKMAEDDTIKKCIKQGYSLMFDGLMYGYDVIGDEKSINSITPQKLLNFKKRNYTAENIVISISGTITFSEAKKLIEKHFVEKLENSTNDYKTDEYCKTEIKDKYIIHKKDNEQSIVYILTDLKEQSLHNRVAFRLFYAIIGMGMSSKFFEIIRGEKGLVYNIDADCTKIGKNFLSEILFATSNENVSKAILEIKNILKECANGGINQEELSRAKNKYVSEMIFSKESNSSIAESNGLDLLEYNKIISDEQLIKEYNSITLEEILKCAKYVYEATDYVVSGVGKCKLTDLKKY